MKNQRIQRISDLIQNAVNEISILKTEQKNGIISNYNGWVYISNCTNHEIEPIRNATNWNELVKSIGYSNEGVSKFQIMELEGRINFKRYKQDCIDYVEFFQIDSKISKLKVKINNWVQTLQSYVYQKLKEQPDYTDAYQTSITKIGYTKVVHVTIRYRDYIWMPKTCTFSANEW